MPTLPPALPPEVAWTIGAVERDTGIPKDTLRIWERRYRFPVPGRDARGERVYSPDQVEKLRVMKRLIDRGHRPGKIVGRGIEELLALSRPAASEPRPGDEDLAAILDLLREHRVDELRQAIARRLMRQGVAGFCQETVAPLNRLIGEAWMDGRIQIHEEHLYTEAVQRLLRQALAPTGQPGRAPRVLLSTLPGEQHGLGLLMAEAILSMEGATCLSLGTQTPAWDLARAAATDWADVVALSFSASYPAEQAIAGLAEMRSLLPGSVALWAGGENPALARRRIAGVLVIRDLGAIPAAVAGWRREHGVD